MERGWKNIATRFVRMVCTMPDTYKTSLTRVTKQKDLTVQALKGHLVMFVEFVLKVGVCLSACRHSLFYSLPSVPPKEFLGDIWPLRFRSGFRNCVQANSLQGRWYPGLKAASPPILPSHCNREWVRGFSLFEEKKAIGSAHPPPAPMATPDSQGPGYWRCCSC